MREIIKWIWFGAVAGCFSGSQASEWRGLWVDAFRDGFKSPEQTTRLVEQARRGHFNTIFVQVRKRGDAYYRSSLEPQAADVPADYDPLADLLAKAHDTSRGRRLQVHAWVVVYPVWNRENAEPAQPDHPFNQHPEWLTEDVQGRRWDGSNFSLDPGHPGVQEHLWAVMVDLLEGYEVDGLHFDYIRYSGNTWGYNPTAVQRFNDRHLRTGRPAPTDPDWLQFRRDQVTQWLRRLYLTAWEIRPGAVISAATITWAPGITTTAEWPQSAAYSAVLQDWRQWMGDGILDLNVPMAYFRQATHARDFAAWSGFASSNAYGRQVAVGLAGYLNSPKETKAQIQIVRRLATIGRPADGIAIFAYAVPSTTTLDWDQWAQSLTSEPGLPPGTEPVFAAAVDPPPMTWKEQPNVGHLSGRIVAAEAPGREIDGAEIAIMGPQTRELRADANGFYGAPNLAPGHYTLEVSSPEREPARLQCRIEAGEVTRQDIMLARAAEPLELVNLKITSGPSSAVLSWNTVAPHQTWIEYWEEHSPTNSAAVELRPKSVHTVLLSGLAPDRKYVARVGALHSRRPSVPFQFQTATEIVVDNSQAQLDGTWMLGSSSLDKFGPDYQFAASTTGEATASATFRPKVWIPGAYSVEVWYPAGANRSQAAPFEVVTPQGRTERPVDQTTGGGAWHVLEPSAELGPGTNAFVRLTNGTGETKRVVMADAVRFVLADKEPGPTDHALPGWWSDHFFGRDVRGTIDHDLDGHTTAAEYRIGTDPTRADSHLELRLLVLPDQTVRIEFEPYMPGRRYLLERRADFFTGRWVPLDHLPLIRNAQGRGTWTDPGHRGAQGYYRVRVQFPE